MIRIDVYKYAACIDAICGVQIREWLKEMGIAENI